MATESQNGNHANPFVVKVFNAGSQGLTSQEARTLLISKIDFVKEYTLLGLKFEGRPEPRGSGKISCYSRFRQESKASAYIDITDGTYHDSGNDTHLSFFDFAKDVLGHSDWTTTLETYAGKYGVDFHARGKTRDGFRIEDVYLYTDENGVPVYQVEKIRLEDGSKRFSQFPTNKAGSKVYKRTDANGNKIGLMEGIERYPYRLVDLIRTRHKGDIVWIVEGEKDVDRLRSLGYTATTNSQGSQSSDLWIGMAKWLSGREVIIVPDNDPPGLKHARRVGEILKGSGASVQFAHCFTRDLKKGGDISDWLDANPGVSLWEYRTDFTLSIDLQPSEALEAPQANQEAQPQVSPEDLEDATLADVEELEESELWVWKGWIPRSQVSIVAAPGGLGKTTLILDLIARIQGKDTGSKWPDGQPVELQGDRVMIIPADMHHHELRSLARARGIDPTKVFLNTTKGALTEGTFFSRAEDYQALKERIARIQPELVIIDTIGGMTDLNLDSSQDAGKIYRPLQVIAMETSVGIVCISHTNASGGVLGRRGVDKCRSVITLTAGEADRDHIRMEVTKSWSKKPPAIGCRRQPDGTFEYDDSPPASSESSESQGKKPRSNGAKASHEDILLTIESHGENMAKHLESLPGKHIDDDQFTNWSHQKGRENVHRQCLAWLFDQGSIESVSIPVIFGGQNLGQKNGYRFLKHPVRTQKKEKLNEPPIAPF